VELRTPDPIDVAIGALYADGAPPLDAYEREVVSELAKKAAVKEQTDGSDFPTD
jgi:hypothetical protein